MSDDLPLWGVCLGAEVLSCVLAAVLARRDRPLRIVALLASLCVVADVEIFLSGIAVLDVAPRPYRGLARLLYHVETALLLAQPWAVLAAAGSLFLWPRDGRRVCAAALGGWLLICGALVGGYPLERGWTPPILHAACLGPTLFGLGAVYAGRRRPWRRAHLLVLLLLCMLLAIGVIGPFVRGKPYTDWHFARLSGVVGFSAVALLCAAWLGGWSWPMPSSFSDRSSPSSSGS